MGGVAEEEGVELEEEPEEPPEEEPEGVELEAEVGQEVEEVGTDRNSDKLSICTVMLKHILLVHSTST